ncbi:cold-shock protein [Pseudomonas sp. H1_A03]
MSRRTCRLHPLDKPLIATVPFVLKSPLPVNFDSSQCWTLAVPWRQTLRAGNQEMQEVIMERVIGTIKSYSRTTGEGLIEPDGEREPVMLDLNSSAGLWFRKGQRVQFSRIHRPKGIYAYRMKLI